MILCIGLTPALQRTLIFDRLELNAVNRTNQVREGASGKSVNVARVLRTMERDVLVGGFLGGDTGKRLRCDLDQADIRQDWITVKAPTRICTTLVDRDTATATELVEEPAAIGRLYYRKVLDRLPHQLAGADLLVLSGSLPPGAPADFYAQCIRQARAAHVRVILDTQGAPLAEAVHERPFAVKLNQRELGDTLGAPLHDEPSLIQGMKMMIQRGVCWVIVTQGAAGATLSDGNRVYRLHIPTITPVNAIGSGDAFAAGLAASLTDGLDLPEACRLGGACGVANAMTDQAGHVVMAEVSKLLESIHIEEIALY